ncbi:TPA: hypothetical protein I1T43_002336 [Staphylococcus aureus]|nr:hypothetical protein [Staphylococcus aureus]
MANTKTQKPISMSKTKSENIVEWIVNDAHWKLLADNLGLGKTAIFRYKKQIKGMSEEKSPFYALGELLTINQLNTVIELFNDFIEHPEKYEKPKKKSDVDLKSQAEVIQKHTKDMNMDYLSYTNKPTASAENEENVDNSNEKENVKKANKTDVVTRHNAERQAMLEEIQALPKDSPERIEKERAYKSSEADRISEFWDAQKREQQDK